MKSDLKTIFRRLIVAEILTIVGYGFAAFYLNEHLPPEILRYNEQVAERDGENVGLLTVAAAVFLMWLFSVVLLWRFVSAGRILYTAATLFGAVLVAGMAPTFDHQMATFFSGIATLISGVLIGLMYFSNLSEKFGARTAE